MEHSQLELDHQTHLHKHSSLLYVPISVMPAFHIKMPHSNIFSTIVLIAFATTTISMSQIISKLSRIAILVC